MVIDIKIDKYVLISNTSTNIREATRRHDYFLIHVFLDIKHKIKFRMLFNSLYTINYQNKMRDIIHTKSQT